MTYPGSYDDGSDEVYGVYGEESGGIAGAGAGMRPKVLLMGLRRSGKTSIQKVVFQKMAAQETSYLESSTKVSKHDIATNSFVSFEVWDFPGQLDAFDGSLGDPAVVFQNVESVVFVVDIQDELAPGMEPLLPVAITRLIETIVKATAANPHVAFDVFLHKVDGLSDDRKVERSREIQQRVLEETQLYHLPQTVQIHFHLTSIYDLSIFDAFSKVIQRLVREKNDIEALLTVLVQHSRIEIGYLFDLSSKTYLAKSDPVASDASHFQLASDAIDVAVDLAFLYAPFQTPIEGSDDAAAAGDAASGAESPSAAAAGEKRPLEIATERDGAHTLGAGIHLTNGYSIFVRQIGPTLALVCVVRTAHTTSLGLLDVNFRVFRQGVEALYASKSG